MNPSDDQPIDIEELRDRLVDCTLDEVIGGRTPPDLSTKIVEPANAPRPAPSRIQAKSRRLSRRSWIALAVAASLLIGLTATLLPSVQSARETAQRPSSTSGEPMADATHGAPGDALVAATAPTPGQEIASERGAVQLSPVEERVVQLEQLARTRAPAGERYAGWNTGGPRRMYRGANTSTDGRQYWGFPSSGPPKVWSEDKSQWELQLQVGARFEHEAQTEEGIGPGLSGDQYTRIYENPFVKAVGGDAVSTFSIDVDTASYANVRQFLMGMNQLPPPDAVRIEELINYFDYRYAGPPAEDEAPFAAHVEVAACPWAPDHRLVRIGIKGRDLEDDKRPASNLVFLVDVSGSMDEPNKLPLVVHGLRQLARELGEDDRVAIVVYASSEGLVLPSTSGDKQETIVSALDGLRAGGSTAGGAGIQLAYQIAEDNFIRGGTNRVILCTDGDFNVGVTSTAELERLVEKKAKDTGVFLSVLGFGRGNLNDAMMEAISNRGNGNYHYVDNQAEARKVLVEEMAGTLVTIAKDVKIQVEFNPATVAGYRLVGYENRLLRTEDFNDDTKDAGEIGAGHTVTALYEVVPAGQAVDTPPVDDLKYQQPATEPALANGELLTLKMRYKQPDGDVSRKLQWPVIDEGLSFTEASGDFQFAAAVAGFGLLLRDSEYKGNLTYDAVIELAEAGVGSDEHGYRSELVEMVRRAKAISEQ